VNYTITTKSTAKCASITSIWVYQVDFASFWCLLSHTPPMVDSQALTQAQTVWEALLRQRRAAGLMAVLSVTCQAMYYGNLYFFKQPYHTSVLSGQMWVIELLGGNPRWIKDQLGMQKKVFKMFIRKLTSMTNVSDTWHVALEEQVAIFLYIIVTNLSNRKVAECFQCSSQTISKYHFFLSSSSPMLISACLSDASKKS